MNNSDFTQNTIEVAIRLGLLFLLAAWCFKIVSPFIVPVVWGVVIAVAIYPLFAKLKSSMGGRNKLAATVYTLLALTFLITPTVMVSNSLIDTSSLISERYEAGVLKIPPPGDKVKDWPLIGENTYALWSQASENMEATLIKYEAETKKVAKAIVSGAAGAAGTILQFVLSIIISGILSRQCQQSIRCNHQIFYQADESGIR